MVKRYLLFFLSVCVCFSGCSDRILPHRERQFNAAGQIPGVDLKDYASVQTRPNQDSKIAVAAAVAGGGFRATFFTLGVMMELEKNKELKINNDNSRNLLSEIDYFSTVSGGGYAVGFYLAGNIKRQEARELIDSVNKGRRPNASKKLVDELMKLEKDFSLQSEYCKKQKSLGAKILHQRKARTLVNIPFNIEVSTNRKFENQFLYKKEIKLGAIFPKNGTPVKYPFLIANATILGSLAPFRFAPNVIGTFNLGGYGRNVHWYTKNPKNKMFGVNFNAACPLSLALRASSTFPVVFRNITLISNEPGTDDPYLRLIDGGVYDNSGVKTAIDVLSQEKNVVAKYLIIIDCRGQDVPSSFSRNRYGIGLSFIDFDTDQQYFTYQTNIMNDKDHLIDTLVGFKLRDLVEKEGNYAWAPDRANINKGHANTYKRKACEILEQLTKDGVLSEEKLVELVSKYKQDTETFKYIYEITSHIDTGLKLKQWEQDMLVLAGRLVVMLKINKIKGAFQKLYN